MREVRDAAKPQAPLCRAVSDFRPLAMLLLGLWLLASTPAVASKFPWEDYDKRLKASQKVAALDAELFGDSVNLQNGALSFSVTDISIPGNNGLPVALSRAYTVTNQKYAVHDEMLGDWVIQTPAISGIFAPDWISSGTPGNRCSDTLPPPVPVSPDGIQYFLSDVFNGVTLDIPGVGGGELLVTNASAARPSTAGPYRWVTNDQIHVSCLSSIKNGTGEGFLAVGPDGTRYWFDWMAQHWEPNLKKIAYPDVSSGRAIYEITPRRRNLLLATRVEDRFGNWVTYSYSNSWNEPARLTLVNAGDGRQIALTYGTNGRVASATDGTRTWQYTYGSTPKGRITLSGVTRPDGSQWTYGFGAFSDALIEYTESYAAGEIYRGCDWLEHPLNAYDKLVGTITHPSGATGTFTLGIQEHGLSNVPLSCANFTSPKNEPNDDVNLFAISSHGLSLETKQLSGPGLTPATWNYSYDSDVSTHLYPGTTPDWPVCTVGAQCYEPPCSSDACAGSSRTIVAGPDNEWARYTFGNSFRYNEGKLLKVEQGSSATAILQARVDTFDLDWSDNAYPTRFGDSLQENHDGFASEYHRPMLRSDTSRQGETFTWEVEADCALPGGLCMDVFARPLKVRRASTLGYSRVEETTYHDNATSWVLGQTLRLRCLSSAPASDPCNGDVVNEATYDPVTALPITATLFGKLQHTLTYYTDGSLETYKDGRNNVTTLSGWYRGVPSLITHPDATTQSATVNPDGTLASVTNEVGAKTCYGYDAMGRLASITHPSGTQAGVCDASTWNATTQAFVQVQAIEYGIPAGHWRQEVSTGNGRKIAYFDALWRPILTQEYDSGNVAATQRFVRTRHDYSGRNTFTSYPKVSSDPTTGTWTEYDALGRTISVSQDSELGLLVTTSSYSPTSFQVSVTNPIQKTTTTAQFQAWDQPTYDHPLTINHPESATTTIGRDAWGKPVALTRAGPGVGVARTYTYNIHQELCRQVEPETGATLMGYDAAGNLAWSASGLPETVDCNASPNVDPILARKAVRTYDVRNRLDSLAFPDGRGDQGWSYTPDGLPEQVITSNGASEPLVTNAYSYDRRRMLVGESVQIAGLHTWSLGYGYNANGHLTVHTYPLGLAVDYAPNALGQPTRAGSYATAAAYFPNGALKQFTYGNGIVHTLTQNARGLPVRSQDAYGTAAVLDDSYDYDPNGNVAAISDALPGNRGDRDMTYDGLDRLVTATSAMFGGAASYTYDALDNLTRVSLGGTASRDHHYCYDGSNRLTNVKTGSCSGSTVVGLGYDLQGNILNKNGVVFDFDFGNRLRVAAGEAYRYDVHGRRVQSSHATLGDIYSFYGQDGVLRFQRDERANRVRSHVYLGGSLVARLEQAAAPPTSAPALTAPASSGTGSYTVSWTSVDGATSYQLQQRKDGGAWSTIHDAVGTSKAVSGVTTGAYDYWVRACNAVGCGAFSPVKTVQVLTPPTSAPGLTLPASNSTGSYTVSWTAVGTAASYELQEQVNGGTWGTLQDTSATSRSISGKTSASYGYRVRACNASGCGGYSATNTVVVTLPPTGVPALTAPATTNTGSYTVSWTGVSAATRYELQEQVNGGTWTLTQSTSAISRSITGKGNGTYGYQVRACNDGGCAAFSAVKSTVVTLPPTGVPTLTAPATSNTGSYSVSWTSVSTATRYELQEQVNGGTWTLIHNTSAISRSITGKGNGTYGYQVRACNAGGCAAFSATKSTLVTHPPASAPTLTAPASSNTGSYTVSWTSVITATRYELQEQVNGGAWTLIQNTSAVSRAITGKGNGTYGYQVRACNDGGCAAFSAVKSTVVTLPPSGVPTLTAPASSNTGSYTVSWTGVSTATRYELQERVNSGAWTLIQNTSAVSRSITGKGNGSYGYQVRACNAGGCAAFSAIKATVVTHPPASAPALTVPASSNTGSYTVSWTGVSTATRYELQEQVNGGAWTLIQNTSTVSRSITGKGNGTYGYRVRACNVGGCGAFSATGSTVVTHPPASAPSLSVPASSNTGSYTVSWTGVSNATRYELQEQVNGGAWTLIQNTSAVSRAITGKGNGTYGYRVRACNVGGCSGFSATGSTVVTHPPSSAPPLSASTSFSTDGNYTVYWSGVSTATRYELEAVSPFASSWNKVYDGPNLNVGFSGQPDGQYHYRVRACNAGGCGPYSATVSVYVEQTGGCLPGEWCNDPQVVEPNREGI